jgi:NADH-quinone oxidoreductase subunit J
MESVTVGLFPLIVGFLTLVSAVIVISSRNPVVSAVSLMMTLLLTGVLYFGMNAYFIGAVQILIYAGAIAVLFVFIQMLLDLTPMRVQIPGRRLVQGLGILVGLVFFAGAVANVVPGFFEIGGTSSQNLEQLRESQAPVSISLTFLSKYMIPFQVTGVLIMAAIMGAVILGKPARSKN